MLPVEVRVLYDKEPKLIADGIEILLLDMHVDADSIEASFLYQTEIPELALPEHLRHIDIGEI